VTQPWLETQAEEEEEEEEEEQDARRMNANRKTTNSGNAI
jgi:hypothetical protein